MHKVNVLIDGINYEIEGPHTTGSALKAIAGVPAESALFVLSSDGSKQVGDNERVSVDHGERFETKENGGTVKINGRDFFFADRHQTGSSLKGRAGIPLTDVLFLDRPHEDEVIPNDKKVTLKEGEHFHSQPPANYGMLDLDATAVGAERFTVLPQSDGWIFLVVDEFKLPDGYAPNVVQLLVKLPPLFPDAAPDMFWVLPHVCTSSGTAPQGTSTEVLLNERWQRFSWHLEGGAWRPGVSTLRDFMRCVRARFERRN